MNADARGPEVPAGGQKPSGGSLARSVKSGVAWSTLTFGLSKALAFVSLLVLTRLLAPSQFGLIGAVVTLLGLIELNSDLGMKATVIYEQERGAGERVQTAFTVNLVLAAVLATAAFLAAPLVAGFFHAPGHVGLFRLAAVDVLLTGLGGIHDGLLLRDLRFRTRILTEVVSAVVRAGVGVTLAL
ncbi:MAG TPA: oligosaccharide flippase family protein, partial [Solirubrobacteraceae bacterium]|nr:oligosaccharide flippase family protein [Solirubrobacteraceae bacterium]